MGKTKYKHAYLKPKTHKQLKLFAIDNDLRGSDHAVQKLLKKTDNWQYEIEKKNDAET